MNRLESMSVLISAVESGSLSAAARNLGTPLSTVSRKVSELESYLKTRLINRSTRRLTLTDAGQAYISACKRILDDIEEAERAAMGEYSRPKGGLVITAPIVFGRLHVLPIVLEFLNAFREIDIRLTLSDHVINLLDESVDIAVRIGELPDSSLVAVRVGSTRRVICGSPVYFAAHGRLEGPDEIGSHDFIAFEGLMAPGAPAMRARLVVNTAEAAIDAAVAGLGVTSVLSYQIEPALRAGKLQLALEKFEPAPLPISLVHAGGRLLPLKMRAFLDFAALRLKDRLPQG